ncbi:MAG: hypothetical protein MJ172_09745 [Clostridia bacterium]|nr:hypothetical protein [Clostridia bacterium]
MKNEPLMMLSIVFFVFGIAFILLFPMVNEMVVGDQVERHTATVINCTQEYRRSYLGNDSGETRYKFTVTATLEDGKEITAVEDKSFQQREYGRGETITVYGLKDHYKLNRDDLFAPWVGNSEIMYVVVVAISLIPMVISKLKR